MGINLDNIGMITKAVDLLGCSFQDLRVAELGNQKLRHKKMTSKKWFREQGSKHTSFDMNGEDGAVVIDLCRPLQEKYRNKFDLVTNYGTTEHVENQKQVFWNIHDLVRPRGIMVHSLPLEGYWKNHCPYHYTVDFPRELAEMNGYELVFQEVIRKNGKLLDFILRKSSDKDFVGIPKKSITFSKNYKKDRNNLF